MTRIVVKAGLSGKKLGSFLPQIKLSDCLPLSPDISDEELQRRGSSSEPRSSLAEILERLEKA